MTWFVTLSEITVWHWFVLGVVLVALEMLAPGVVFLWLGVAAVITGIAFEVFPGMGWEIQFLLFAGVSLMTVFAGRSWIKRHPTVSEQPNLNIRGAQYIGREFTLAAPIKNGVGIIVVDDTRWKISGSDLPAGRKIKVTALTDQIMSVEAAED